MARALVCSVVVLSFFAVGCVKADETAGKNAKQVKHHIQATITKIDSAKDEITVQMMENGKEEHKELQLSKDAKLTDNMGNTSKLDSFHDGDDVFITEKDGKVIHLAKHSMATIIKMDPNARTVTVKMTDDSGKSVEKTFNLVEDSEYLDTSGDVAVMEVFKSGDEVLIVEDQGKIQAMKKADNKDKMHHSTQHP